jgi:hypothetical protein
LSAHSDLPLVAPAGSDAPAARRRPPAPVRWAWIHCGRVRLGWAGYRTPAGLQDGSISAPTPSLLFLSCSLGPAAQKASTDSRWRESCAPARGCQPAFSRPATLKGADQTRGLSGVISAFRWGSDIPEAERRAGGVGLVVQESVARWRDVIISQIAFPIAFSHVERERAPTTATHGDTIGAIVIGFVADHRTVG